jgi:Fe-S cluster assembly protein SufB
MAQDNLDMDYSKYDFKDSTEMYVHLSKKGLTKETVIGISQMKKKRKKKCEEKEKITENMT